MPGKGDSWNESQVYTDPVTLRRVRRVTRNAAYNMTPNYHTNTGFSADGEYLVFVSVWQAGGAVVRCHVPTGELTVVSETYAQIDTPCLAPRSGWAVFTADGAVRAVHIHSLEERTLFEYGRERKAGRPSVDGDERNVIVPFQPQRPDVLAGERPACDDKQYWTENEGLCLELMQVPLAGGDAERVYREAGCRSAHTPHCPTDPDLLLIDRDFPPDLHGGSDGKTTRIWLLRLSTGELTELPSRDGGPFQVHSAWTFDGRHVLYHGWAREGGWYIGAIDREGSTVREYTFNEMPHYGHVSAAADRPAIILDGNLTTDLLLWLYYDAEPPRIEVIARHGTQWDGAPGQYAHPHPLADPTGRWVSFNAAAHKRSDVYLVEI